MEDFTKYNAPGTILRAAQLRMLDILKEIDIICKRHNITYWLDGGTMLGCARHKGFIPWDDDLDIAVLYKDYHRLLKLLQKELPPKYSIMWHGNNKFFPFDFAKVVDSNSYVEQKGGDWTERAGLHGLWVDIFPMIHGNRPLRKIAEPLYGRCFRRIHNMESNTRNKVLAYLLFPFALCLVGITKILGVFVSKDKYVNSLGTGAAPAQFSTRHRSWTIPTIDMEFEGHMYPMPCNYDAILTAMYGDYMKIPTEDKRQIHIGKLEVYES